MLKVNLSHIQITRLTPEASDDLAQAIYAALVTAGRRAIRNTVIALVVGCLIIWLASWALFTTGITRDSTDGNSPSGLRLYTDHKTGCQYLGTGNNLTPRMDAQGYQICAAQR